MTSPSLQTDTTPPVRKSRWTLFAALVLLAAIASLASVPAEIASLSHVQADIPWWAPIVAFIFGFIPSVAAVAIGIATSPRTALDVPIIRHLLEQQPRAGRITRSIFIPSLLFAIIGFVVVHAFSKWLEPILMPELAAIMREQAKDANPTSPSQLTLLSFAAGVREELIFRFGLMTLFVWGGIRLFRLSNTQPLLLWTANVLAVIPFALVHLLNATALAIPITSGLVVAILFLNGAVGMMCGWLYSRYGLESAIIAHTFYDLIQFIVWPFLDRTVI